MDKEEIKTVAELLQKTDIALDNYEDIFSDFDPSPFEKRILSDDFLSELHRRYSSAHKGSLAVNFTLPGAMRDEKTESLIKKRIKEHFRAQLRNLEKKNQEKTHAGILRLGAGIIFSLLLFLVPQLEVLPLATILSVLIWYSMWTGFESLSEASLRLRKRKAFVERFLRADYHFFSEEDVLQSMQKMREAEATQKEDQKSPGNS